MLQNMPTAIILAAGIGRRLKPVSDRIPKCLLRFGGKTLLTRHLEALQAAGIEQACIVVGHLSELIQTEVETFNPGISTHIIQNRQYEKGSAVSLLCAEGFLTNNASLIIDADVLCASSLLHQLRHHPAQNVLFIDKQFQETGEEVKALVKGLYVHSLGKTILAGDDALLGESLGFYKFSKSAGVAMGESLRRTIAQHGSDVEYETAINNILHKVPFHSIEVTGDPWIEIDFPHDLKRAEKIIFPLLNQSINKN